MKYSKSLIIFTAAALCSSLCFGMEKDFTREQNLEFSRGILKDYIYMGEHEKVFTILKDNCEDFCDDTFLQKEIATILHNKAYRTRGLVSLVLFEISKKHKLNKKILETWKEAALDKNLKYLFVGEEKACNSTIKVMGDQGQTGVALAISESGIISKPLYRKDLDEHYFIISGNIIVALGEEGVIPKKDETIKWTRIKGEPGDHIRIPRNTPVQFKNGNNDKNLIMLVPTTPPYGVIAEKTNYKVETYLDPKKGFWQE